MHTPEHPPTTTTPRFVGIDVGKARLDVAVRPRGEAWQRPHDEPSIAALVSRLQALQPDRIVLEATGGLERLVVSALALVHPSPPARSAPAAAPARVPPVHPGARGQWA